MQEWIGPVVAGVLAVVAVGLGIALVRTRSRTDRALTLARAETSELRAELQALRERLDRPAAAHTPVAAEFTITDLGESQRDDGSQPTPQIGGALFADLVLRESVVKAASLAHGVRRALEPEVRHRIRFEMRREVKRARRQRRLETRQARREGAARQRSSLDEGSAA